MAKICPEQGASLPARWVPGEVEQRLYERWVAAGYFAGGPASGKPAFCVVIPPPNVTGSLHLGHAMDHALIDILTRRRRMQAYDVLWLPGMDHAGIATQNVVERQLAAEGECRHDLGRERFVDRVWDWKRESGGAISRRSPVLSSGSVCGGDGAASSVALPGRGASTAHSRG